MRQELPILLLVVVLFSCVLILVGINNGSDTQQTYSTAYVMYQSPTATPSSTPVTSVTPVEPTLSDASQRAFDRITQLLQQGDYTDYEWQQSFSYNIGLLTYHRVCELEAYRLQSAVDSKDLPLIQQSYTGLEACIGEIE